MWAGFLQLIESYVRDVSMSLARLEVTFDRSDPFYAWRSGAVEQAGTLRGGGAYEMHGTGCAVVIDGKLIDFEFSGSNEVGYDAWRLWKYARQFPQRWPQYQDLDSVDRAFEAAIDVALIARIDRLQFGAEYNDRLYRMSVGQAASVINLS